MLALAVPSFALYPYKTLTQYAHRIWGQEEGLVQPTIYAILQGRDGFLWLGTQDSLIRFDGVHFREYDNAAQAGLQRSLIRALAEDDKGNLWVASVGSGVVCVKPDGGFTRYTTKQGLPSDDTFCVVPEKTGDTWICTTRGLVRLTSTGQIRTFTTADGLPTNQVRGTCITPDGTRWVAALDAGLSRWNGSRFEPSANLHEISALACASDNSVWAGTSNGAIQIKDKITRRFTTAEGLPDNEVSALFAASDGTVWIGTNDGISRYHSGEISVYRTRDGLSHSLVLSLFLDREGSLWAGTKDGLDQFTDGKVTPYSTTEGLLSNNVGPVVEDKKGQLWIGTLGQGLNFFDGHRFQSFTRRNGLLDDTILSLQIDPSGDLWVGSSKGLNKLHNGAVVASYTERDGLPSPAVRAMVVDSEGVLWVGTGRGLAEFQGKRFIKAGLAPPSSVLALSAGHSVRLFVSTDAAGFSYLKDGKANWYALDVTHPVDCFYLDLVRHEAWMGTLGSGLLRWRNGAVTHLRVKDGLFDNRIYSILHDDRGNLWMASSKGIFRVSEEELRDFADGKIRYINSIPFSTGQLRFECRAGVQPAAYRTHDGRLWFATTNGLVVVDPNHLASDTIPPPVEITSIVINGKRVAPEQGIHLGPSPADRNLEVRYAGLSFVSPEKVTFRYKLDGYDKTWTEAGNRREAFFTNLPPGNFRFLVLARNADGVWSKNAAVLSFAVDPRFYQRWWFFPLVALILGCAIFIAVRMRILRIRQRFDLVLAERTRIARELHDTLLQGLSGITMQLQAIWMKLPASKEKIFLGEVIQDAAKCSAEARQSLWGLRSGGPSSTEFSEKLAKLAKAATGQSKTELKLEIQPLSLSALPEKEYQLLMISQEAISNVLQHAHAKHLSIRLQAENKQLELTIEDDGAGFDAGNAPLGHFGVVGMKERADEIGADLTVRSTLGQGTSVRVILPLASSPAEESKPEQTFEHQIS